MSAQNAVAGPAGRTRDPNRKSTGPKADSHRNEQSERKAHAIANVSQSAVIGAREVVTNACANGSPLQNMSQGQLRIGRNEKADAGDIEIKVEKVIELTKASKDAAVVALHDCDYDLNRAVSKILEGDSDDNWTSVSTKSKKEKEKVPAKSQVAESSSKQANGTSHKHVAPAGPRNRTAATTTASRKERPAGERPNRSSKQRDEPRDSGAGAESQPSADISRHPGPRAHRPPRAVRESGPRSGAERRPDAVRRPDGAGSSSANRPRGPRTFSNQQKLVPPAAAADDFPNSIDTWSNTTADPNARPAPAPITSMTVGNWSDVVSGANEDWSEEDYESSLMETKVFVPSGKSLPEADELSAQTTHVQMSDKQKRGAGTGTQAAPLLDRKEAAGAQILQSLKQPPVTQSGYGQISQSYINKQAADSIKSLVGIPTAVYAAAAPPAAHHPADPKPVPSSGRPANQNRRTTRIPESAVEMPSNDSVASLGVQFGALDVSFASADTQSFVKQDVQSLNHKAAMAANTSFEQQAKTVLADDMMKRHDALSGKQEPDIDPRNAVAKHVKSAIDSVKGPDLYSVTGSQSDYKGNASYGNAGSYSPYSSSASTSGQFNVYANPSSYASSPYSTNYQPAGPKNLSNLKDVDTSVPQKHVPYDMQSPAGLVNSTQTTNVLKNSLSATGKGNMSNQNIPRMMTQLMHPSYIMGGMASPAFYPLFDPSMQMPPAAAQDATGYAAAYNQPADTTKFGRSDGVSDGTASTATGVSSQNPVVSQHSQQQQFISTLPPGYGFYYLPSAPGLYQPQGGQFVPVPPVSNAHASSAPGFPKGNYASHSYAGSGYDSSALAMQPDYGKPQGYAPSPNQAKTMPSSDLMGQSSSYSKPHGVSKVCPPGDYTSSTHLLRNLQAYDKMSYPSVGQSATAAYNLTGSQAALGTSAYNSYMVPQNMGQGFPDSSQSQSGVGRSLPAGSKGPAPNAPKNYGQNLYQNPGW